MLRLEYQAEGHVGLYPFPFLIRAKLTNNKPAALTFLGLKHSLQSTAVRLFIQSTEIILIEATQGIYQSSLFVSGISD